MYKLSRMLLWHGLVVVAELPLLCAQAAPSTPKPSNASMAETVAFIRDAYLHQHPVVVRDSNGDPKYDSVLAVEEKDCVLTFLYDNRAEKQDKSWSNEFGGPIEHTRRYVRIFLNGSDPLSVENGGMTPRIIKAIARTDDVPTPANGSRVREIPKHILSLTGFVQEVTSAAIVFVARNENTYILHLPSKNLPLLAWNTNEPVRQESVVQGDTISYTPMQKYPGNYGIFIGHPATSFPAPMIFSAQDLPPLEDPAMVDRVSKALVHAIVLCHKDVPPSPF